MVFSRIEAVVLASFIKMLNMNNEDFVKYSESACAEIESEIVDIEKINEYTRKYVEGMFSNYKNDYLATFLSEKLSVNFRIVGIEPNLFVCPCCEYRTLKKNAEYSICNVCFWEDDGTKVGEDYSSVNGMPLIEGKNNFMKFGACEIKFLKFLDDDRFMQYESR